MSALVARYRSWPRAIRWAFWGGLAVLFYFLVYERVLDLTNRFSSRADIRSAELRTFAGQRIQRQAAESAVVTGVSRYGKVAQPGPAAARSEAFNKLVTKVLEDQGIKDPSVNTKDQPMPAGPLSAVAAADERLERLVSDIKFDGTPEQLAGVIAALEKIPEVAVVSRVQISPGTGDKSERLLKVAIAAEAWQVQKKVKR